MNFSEITKALAEISSISSGNEKLAWLKAHDDEDLKEVFEWYFDNSYPTGISEKKYGRGIAGSTSVKVNITFSDVMNYLKVHNTGKDSDLDYIMAARTIICATPEESECYRRLVCKNYPMGIDAKTINKVFKNLVPTFDVCLCDKYYDRSELVDGTREFAISIKIDGCVSSDTKIVTERGDVTIKNAIENNDEFVLSYNHETNELEFQEIENTMIKESDKKWYEIILENGSKLKITENDMLYLPELGIYRKVSDLEIGDNILTLEKR